MAEFDQLQEALRQQLITLFQEHGAPQLSASAAATAATDPDALAFEPLGIPLPYSGFRLSDAAGTLSAQMANETLTALADAVPDVAGGEYRRSVRSIAGSYEQTLFALPVPGQTQPLLAAIERNQAEARELFERAKQVSLGSLIDYRPVATIPAAWYDPAAPVWTPFKSSASAGGTASVVTPTATVARTAVAIPSASTMAPNWTWKVMSASDRTALASALTNPGITTAQAPAPANAAPRPKAAVTARIGVITVGASATLRKPLQQDKATVLVKEVFRPDIVLDHAPPPKAVETKPTSLQMKFEVCVLALTRPWMQWSWLDTGGWYMPGVHSGQLCAPGQPLHRINVSAILVRNLTLSAQGASSDELKDAVAFGPLQFLDRQVEVKAQDGKFDVAITCPTVQLIGWVTQLLSGLPPKTDPTLPET